MKIYLASSWRNPFQQHVLKVLRQHGHEVYDFKHPKPGDDGFSWGDVAEKWQGWDPVGFKEGLNHPIAEAGFKSDMDALKWCDACVLLLPCGKSAHLEAGWVSGAGKKTVIILSNTIPLHCADNGHSMGDFPCAKCGDLDGCHEPARFRQVEPELMYKMADLISCDMNEVLRFLS
jgi:hypothetical protein